MKIIAAEFVTSAALRPFDGHRGAPGTVGGRRGPREGGGGPPSGMSGIPRDGLAQIAFAGRSNVGKSTLLNALCRRTIARTSAAPGKTRMANVYRVAVEGGAGGPGRWAVYFVDLPGFGYARGGSDAAVELAAVAEGYFARRESGSGGGGSHAVPLLLVDSRHPGLASDIQAHAWFAKNATAPHVVATKIDKLSRAERARNMTALEDTFGTAALPVSATSGEGLDELWTLIAKLARNR